METAMQELIKQCEHYKKHFTKDTKNHRDIRLTYQNVILIIENQLLEKEKNIIKNAYTDGCINWDSEKDAEQYYQDTYKTK